MDTTLKHSTSTGSGHHEVHLCHRCNWPFPNPNPSSRHRRAHKRVCGTVQGYELDQSHPPVSDDSDENNNNQKQKVVSTKNIDGVGKFSRARSEEDVFSDAITEFSDTGISSPQTENTDHKTIEGDFSASSKLKVVDDSADKTDQLNDPTNIDQTFESGAMVNAMDHFEGVALTTDAKLEPISVGLSNGLQSDTDGVDNVNELEGDKGTEEVLVKAKEDTATRKEESDLDFSTLNCEEEKLLNPVLDAAERKDSDPVLVEAERKELVAEVVKHDSSGQIDTFEEIDAAKEVKTEVSDSVECSSVVPVDSFIEKEGDNGSFGQNEEESISDKQVKTECLNGGSGNGEVSKEVQEKLASAMHSDHSTETQSDLYSNAEILEEDSELESRDNAIEIPTRELESETSCDTQVKNDIKVEAVTVAGTEPKLNHIGDLSELKITPEQNDSEIFTKSFGNENKCANEGEISIELNHDENLAVVNKIQQESSLGECLKEKLPSGEEHTDENFTFTPVLDKSTASPVNFQVLHESSAGDVSGECKSLQDEGGDVIVIKENEGISQSTTNSVSAVSQTKLTEDKSETNSQEPKPTTDKTDDFEPPSFMTLVNHVSEIETVQQTTQHPKTDALQAGWFPSLTNVVNKSDGRKKNEEKIAKVTQHIPLKNLLIGTKSPNAKQIPSTFQKEEGSIEARSPNAKQIPSTFQKEEDSAKENGADARKVNSAVDVEVGKEMDKEWDSPAKYPIESKKEKKGFWMPFACCSTSVHRDLQ